MGWLYQITEITRCISLEGQPFYMQVAFWPSRDLYSNSPKRGPTDPGVCKVTPYLLKDWIILDLQNDDVDVLISEYVAEAELFNWTGCDTYHLEREVFVDGVTAPKGDRIQPRTRVDFQMNWELRRRLAKLEEMDG